MTVPAWIIPITDNTSVAVGEFELIHILPDDPVLFNIPLAPSYCHHVLIWQNEVVPVLNLAKRFSLTGNTTPQSDKKTNVLIGIFAYRNETYQEVEYGALFMSDTPYHCDIDDEQNCDLPTRFMPWTIFMSSCIHLARTQQSVPILRLERLFASSESIAI